MWRIRTRHQDRLLDLYDLTTSSFNFDMLKRARLGSSLLSSATNRFEVLCMYVGPSCVKLRGIGAVDVLRDVFWAIMVYGMPQNEMGGLCP